MQLGGRAVGHLAVVLALKERGSQVAVGKLFICAVFFSERAEVRQWRDLVIRGNVGVLLLLLCLEEVSEFEEHLDEVGDAGTGRANVRHEEHRVAARLVHLDAIPVHEVHVLERVTVNTGLADLDGDAARVDDELGVVP